MLLQAGYPIEMEPANFAGLQAFLSRTVQNRQLFLFTDDNVRQHCLPVLIQAIPSLAGIPVYSMLPGEPEKNIETVMNLGRFLAEHNAGRDALLINLGGGVVTDTGGFAASVYKRGIPFVHLPTTLLAQIDASVGAKTGIDAFGLKNSLGTFAQPEAVFIYPGFLETLDRRQIRSGFAEALKHALIADKSYWNELNRFDFLNFDSLISRSLEIKSAIVQSDPKESGERKKLNFGHTVGHAIESYFVNRNSDAVTHGEAVAAGMLCEAWISWKQNHFPEAEFQEMEKVLRRFYEPVFLSSAELPELLRYMQNDKKNAGSQTRFTLLNRIGDAAFDCAVATETIEEALSYYMQIK